ncbi:hypothetical protein ODQ17_13120, partial [Acinetobacter sp. IRS14]|nr:hypothetical protein [Acinetobacter sp. IRS14]
ADAVGAVTPGATGLGWGVRAAATTKTVTKARELGGAHRTVKGVAGNEAHHMPANAVSPFSTGKGPAISMSKADHQKTKSWGSSKEAKAYRAEQKKLIEQGKFKEAQRMDIDDIQSTFGTKYDGQMYQMRLYTDHLLNNQSLKK